MRVQMLGTGSADGWPNPFCTCRSCASQRATGHHRGSTAALVDQAILIDCGPTVAAAAAQAGIDLRSVEHVLITHGHPDHLAPALLLWRQWIDGLGALHLWGPAGALELCTHWIAPGAPVHLHPVQPGDHVDLPVQGHGANYRLSVYPAAHAHGDGDALAQEAVLFGLADPDGRRLLYATDTGRLPPGSLRALHGMAFDLALVDATFGTFPDHGTGHLDLATLPVFLDELRAVGALTPASDVIAVHLSHHNPPADELQALLAPMGARIVDDLAQVSVPTPPLRLRHLILGGARSGKSRYAEALANEHPRVTYVATAAGQPGDAEWAERVRLHRQRRPAHWRTEETADLPAALRATHADGLVLVDCIGMWLTAQLDAAGAWSEDPAEVARARAAVLAAVDDLLEGLAACPGSVLMVTNEVGMDVVPATSSGRLFRDLLGTVNARLAAHCAEVTLVVAGRPLPLPRTPPAGPDPASEG